MLFLTFTLLMLQLRSVSRSLLVFITGPLGIPGVAAALLLLGRPFGFVALLGVVALMGMIQRNSVIRSEEHTSELQSQSNLVCRLLLEKKKNKKANRASRNMLAS